MRLLRCLLVTTTVTGVAAAASALLAPVLVAPAPGFEGTLVRLCAAVAAGCALWGWLGALVVVAEALAAPAAASPARTPGVPSAVRRAVLAACGVAVSVGGPALAAPGGDAHQGLPAALAGLPFPARAMDLPARTHHVVLVRPGDSLWAITARRLSPTADDAEITAGWRALYARNRAVVGDDPSLIHPGQELTLPDDLEEPG